MQSLIKNIFHPLSFVPNGKRTTVPALLPGLALLLSVAVVNAARPFHTDDAGTVPAGQFELESGANYGRSFSDAALNLTHGLTTRLDLGVDAGFALLPRSSREFTSMNICLKCGLVHDLLALSVGATLHDPLYSVNLIFSRSKGVVTLHANLGMEVVAATTDALATWGSAAVFTVGRVDAGLELAGTHQEVSWWQAGLSVPLTGWLALDSGVGGGFARDFTPSFTSGLWVTF